MRPRSADASGMSENASEQRRMSAAKIAGPIVAIAILIAVLVFDPLGHLAQAAWSVLPEFPDGLNLADLPDLPDIPRWLRFLIGPGKLIVIAVIALRVAWGEGERRRRSDRGDGG